MRDVDQMHEKIEIALEQRQVALLAVAALVLLGVVFAAGVQVGRQITGSAAAAPAQPSPDDLPALDRAEEEGAAGAAAKVAPLQPPTRVERPPAPVAPPEEAVAAAPAKVLAPAKPPAAAKAPAPAEEPAVEEPVKAPPAPGSVRVAVVEPQSPARAVVPKPPDDEVQLTPPPRGLLAFTVQIGAAQDKRDAQRLEAKARGAGLKPYVVEADLGAKGLWYRVRVGSFASKDVALRYKLDVERELRLSAVIMPTK